MRNRLTIILLLFVTLVGYNTDVFSQSASYHSQHLKDAVDRLHIASLIDTLQPGKTVLSIKGQKVYILIDRNKEVTHIGVPLFSKAVRELRPSPIYDYLEYALLDHLFSISLSKLTYKELKFIKGSWNEMKEVTDSTDVTISNEQNKHYRVIWNLPKNKDLEIRFPIKYDMLANSSRKEMENIFLRELRNYKERNKHTNPIYKFEKKDLVSNINGSDTIYIKEGSSFLDSNIKNNLYLIEMDSSLVFVYGKKYPVISLCNMLLTGDVCGNRMVNLDIKKIDFQRESEDITINAFIAFLKTQNCELYFECNKRTESQIKFTLYAVNNQMGYTHMFTFNSKTDNMLSSMEVLQAKSFLYIPISNIKNLFKN